MPDLKKKGRKPVLLITVASLAAATILYLEFFADPIIDPPEFFSDANIQIQYLTSRSPFSRRVVSRLVTVDRLSRPAHYVFRGRDIQVNQPHPSILSGDCVLISEAEVVVGLPGSFDLLWSQRGYISHLRGSPRNGALSPFLASVAEETGDLHLARFTWGYMPHGKMD